MKSDSLRLSLPRHKTVRGYRVTRAPLGRFLSALSLLGDFPQELMQSLMPGGDIRELLLSVRHCNAKLLWQLLGRALKVAPEQTLRLVAALADISWESLLNDPDMGLDGLCELVLAWWEVNNLDGFFAKAGALRTRIGTLAGTKAGSSV